MKISIEKFKPLQDFVLIEFEPNNFTTKSGIIYKITPEVVNDRPTEGKVIAIGPKVQEVKIGDTVKFEVIRGYDIDKTHLLLCEKTILGILE